jgi:hypothetical protein
MLKPGVRVGAVCSFSNSFEVTSPGLTTTIVPLDDWFMSSDRKEISGHPGIMTTSGSIQRIWPGEFFLVLDIITCNSGHQTWLHVLYDEKPWWLCVPHKTRLDVFPVENK